VKVDFFTANMKLLLKNWTRNLWYFRNNTTAWCGQLFYFNDKFYIAQNGAKENMHFNAGTSVFWNIPVYVGYKFKKI